MYLYIFISVYLCTITVLYFTYFAANAGSNPPTSCCISLLTVTPPRAATPRARPAPTCPLRSSPRRSAQPLSTGQRPLIAPRPRLTSLRAHGPAPPGAGAAAPLRAAPLRTAAATGSCRGWGAASSPTRPSTSLSPSRERGGRKGRDKRGREKKGEEGGGV